MPFYDYRCEHCGNFRALRPMSGSGAGAMCPSCNAWCDRVLVTPFLGGKGQSASAGSAGVFDRSRFRHVCGVGCSHQP